MNVAGSPRYRYACSMRPAGSAERISWANSATPTPGFPWTFATNTTGVDAGTPARSRYAPAAPACWRRTAFVWGRTPCQKAWAAAKPRPGRTTATATRAAGRVFDHGGPGPGGSAPAPAAMRNGTGSANARNRCVGTVAPAHATTPATAATATHEPRTAHA